MVKIETDIDYIKNKIDETHQMVREHIVQSQEQIDCLDKKFAGKWTEKIAVGLIVSVAAGILTFIFMNV